MYEELIERLRTYTNDGTDDLRNEAADAIEELSAAVAGFEATTDVEFVKEKGHERIRFVPKWISVKERLPEDLQNVLVIDEGRVTIGHCEHYYGEEEVYVEWHDTLYYPIDPPYWVPLPEPPKEKTE